MPTAYRAQADGSGGVSRREVTRYEVRVEDRTFTVELEDLPDGRTRVGVDGQERCVEVRSLGAGAWSLSRRPEGAEETPADTARYQQRYLQIDGSLGKLVVEISHPDGEPRSMLASVSVARPSGASAGGGVSATLPRDIDGAAPMTLRAPIPGKVVKIAVKVGDRVVAGQSLLVLEAMKMENEIRAPRDGEVKTVYALEGASVDAGQDLVALS